MPSAARSIRASHSPYRPLSPQRFRYPVGPMPCGRMAVAAPGFDREHLDFLKRMAAEGVIGPDLARTARGVWTLVKLVTDCRLPVPAATARPGGPVAHTWDIGSHHLEAEVPDPRTGPAEWFYANRQSPQVWSADLRLEDGFPPELESLLDRIARSAHAR